MLERLVRFSLRFRGAVIALASVTLGYGVWVAGRAKFDVYPEFAPPQVIIQTEAPGLDPEEVEQLVTRPIENTMNGAPGLESIRSQSIQGLSVITIFFHEATDIYRARQMIGERLAEAAGRLPRGVETPAMAPLTGATSLVLVAGLTSQHRSPMDLRTFADWTLRPRLLAVPGVARVSIFGGEVRQLQIQVSPARLAAYSLGLNEVLAAGRNATGVRGGGFVDTPGQRVVVQTRGQSIEADELAEAVVAHHRGVPVRLKDVARVADAAEPKIGEAAVADRRGVLVLVSSQYGSNTLEITGAIERALDEMKPALAAERITLHPALFRPANFITTAIRNVNYSLALGGVLVSVVLFLFLFNLRTAFISLTAIPLSLVAAVIVLDRLGISLNTLTLGGLAIAIGEVVDDAIIDVENIFRRLRENARSAEPRPRARVVLEASLEVRGAVVYATFVVALVFLPVLTMPGIQGRLFAPLGIAYVLAILASLAVALTLTPALCYLLLARGGEAAGEPRAVIWLKTRYRGLLLGLSRRPARVQGAALVACAAAAAAVPFFGGEFLPELREGHLIVHMAAAPGTSLEESLRLGGHVTRELLKNPRIATVAQQIGRAEMADDTWGTHYSEFHVEFKPMGGEEAERAEAEMRQALGGFAGVHFALRPFLVERIEEIISGVTAQVVIKIFGDDFPAIDGKAREVARLVESVRGAADVQVESPPGAPAVSVSLRRARLQQLGFQPVQVLEAIEAFYRGAPVAQTYEANRVVNVAVILDRASRGSPEALASLPITSPAGVRVPLGELAEVRQTTGRYSILHEATRRRQAVTCNVRGRDVAGFVDEVKRKVSGKVDFPPGTYVVYSGAAEAHAEARRDLILRSLVAASAILVLLSMVFRGPRNLLLVLVNLPFALVGGVLAVFAGGGVLSVGSMVGFVTLFGITTRNSIMLISHFEHLVSQEGMPWGIEAAVRGAVERLLPVLMTAIVTALGLLPLALGAGEPGREIEGPMAMVILGGLATSTALTLTVLPVMALRWARFERRETL